ncbi:MAG: iron-containing alcohol dehydrogenase [Planctomycetaceae bacterium]|nr:iron-containing alcohol dehydrogenase [Planctomycetaceae bacterium]
MTQLANFTFSSPTSVAFGNGAIKRLGDYIAKMGATKALIITDKVMVDIGLTKQLADHAGVPCVVFDGVSPEPPVENTLDSLAQYRENGCDVIIGLGGGSPLDVAKAAAMLASNGGSYTDYVGIGKVPKRCAPLILIPTTAGTGSETSIFSIMLVNGLKAGVMDSNITAHVAIVDPLLTVSVPRKLTAATGLDAFCHSMETLISTNANPMSDTLALKAIALLTKWLPKAVAWPENIEARYWVMFASMIGGYNSNTCEGAAANHGFAFSPGGLFHVPHGLANAVFLHRVLPITGIAEYEKMRLMGEVMGENMAGLSDREAFAKTIQAVRNLVENIGCDIPLREFGVKESDVDALADEVLKQARVMGHSTYRFSREEIIAVFRAAI